MTTLKISAQLKSFNGISWHWGIKSVCCCCTKRHTWIFIDTQRPRYPTRNVVVFFIHHLQDKFSLNCSLFTNYLLLLCWISFQTHFWFHCSSFVSAGLRISRLYPPQKGETPIAKKVVFGGMILNCWWGSQRSRECEVLLHCH